MIEFTRGEWIAIAAIAVPTALWILDKYFGIDRALWTWNDTSNQITVKLETDTIPEGSEGKVTLTIEGYERQVRARISDAMARRDQAGGAGRDKLTAQIGELEGRSQNIEPAVAPWR